MASVASLLEGIYEGHVVDGTDIARVSGTHPRTVARWQADDAVPRRDAEERLLELKAVVELLRRVMSDSTARVWLRTPNPDLDYEKPLDLIGQGRFREVISLVLAIAEGVTA
jgi:uncharacterized protein (DUF2384 family)